MKLLYGLECRGSEATRNALRTAWASDFDACRLIVRVHLGRAASVQWLRPRLVDNHPLVGVNALGPTDVSGSRQLPASEIERENLTSRYAGHPVEAGSRL